MPKIVLSISAKACLKIINGADYGGAIFVEQCCNIYLSKTTFVGNYASQIGGVMISSSHESISPGYCKRSDIKYIGSSNITITESDFYGNSVVESEGALYSGGDFITIKTSGFYNNSAPTGGVLGTSAIGSHITIEASEFYNNSALWGGIIWTSGSTIITIGGSNFTKNQSPREQLYMLQTALK